jgi:hypothetical protein
MMENKKLIFEEIKDRLKDQINLVDQITAKFNIVLGFNSIILAFLIQAFVSKVCFDWWIKASAGLIFISLLIDLRGLIMHKYRRDPDPWGLYKNYYNKNIEETIDILIQNFVDSFNENVRKLHRINRWYTISIGITAIALLLIIIEFFKGDVISIWGIMKTNLKM